jgi:hypothetical protein
MNARRRAIAFTTIAALAAVIASVAIAASPSPVSGSIAGPVTSVNGRGFTVKTSLSPTGSSRISLSSKTTIRAQVAASRADLKKGACIMATGQRGKNGVVTATRISVTQPINAKCGGGFGPGNGPGGTQPPAGSRPQPPANGGPPPGRFGGAFGTIITVNGSNLTVKGPFGNTTVVVSPKSALTRTQGVGPSAIKVEQCAFVFGTSADRGVTVQAQNVNLSQPTSAGCTAGFPRR